MIDYRFDRLMKGYMLFVKIRPEFIEKTGQMGFYTSGIDQKHWLLEF
jgi:hypothetical protein